MTHPQRSPETLVGSFAKQVFSLAVRELGQIQPRRSCWRGLSLLHPNSGLAGDTPPLRLA